jgi:plasmid stabilization system protein ParE
LGEHFSTPRSGLVRRHAIGNYVVYYRPIIDGVEIVRVIHGARDERGAI